MASENHGRHVKRQEPLVKRIRVRLDRVFRDPDTGTWKIGLATVPAEDSVASDDGGQGRG